MNHYDDGEVKQTSNKKLDILINRMLTEEEQTNNFLDKYLPKSKIRLEKNLDIKLVPSNRTALGKATESRNKK